MIKTQPAAEITPSPHNCLAGRLAAASAASDGLARAPVEGPDASTRVAITDPTGELQASATAEFRRGSDRP
jgi:hypothetical protein